MPQILQHNGFATQAGDVISDRWRCSHAWDEAYDPARVPVECRLAVYVTDDELDELVPAIVEDLGIERPTLFLL
ncbi:hypothetical protein [Nocardia sp. NPDC047648]|uniref:hypothetical protein n=1 Tax=Nocardia sp. NPDC047648 TaxID=3155625 RepID=UPI0033DEA9AD